MYVCFAHTHIFVFVRVEYQGTCEDACKDETYDALALVQTA
jgi:hypothetical protein